MAVYAKSFLLRLFLLYAIALLSSSAQQANPGRKPKIIRMPVNWNNPQQQNWNNDQQANYRSPLETANDFNIKKYLSRYSSNYGDLDVMLILRATPRVGKKRVFEAKSSEFSG